MKNRSNGCARAYGFTDTLALLLVIPVLGLLSLGACSTMPDPEAEPIKVGQVIQMTKAGVPPQEIVDAIEASGTVYRLSDTQLTALKQQGVSQQVIDYMKSTHAEAVNRDETLDTDSAWILEDDGYRYGGCFYPDFPAAYC